MMLSMKRLHVYPKNRNPKKIIENITLQLDTVCKASQQLEQLETKLNNFDPETAYARVHDRLIEEYDIAKNRYKSLDLLRKAKISKGLLSEEEADERKEKLVKQLDPIVNALNKDFKVCAEEKYLLLDEIFLVRTNSHLKCDFEKMDKMIELVVRNPGIVLEEELGKMKRIHELLELEERKLNDM